MSKNPTVPGVVDRLYRGLWPEIERMSGERSVVREAYADGGRGLPRFSGWQEGAGGRMQPVYRVRAWRVPNEDGPNPLVRFNRIAAMLRGKPIPIHYCMTLTDTE